MEDILKSVYEKLKMTNLKVYDNRPAQFTNFPFIIYDLNELSYDENPTTYTLNIDVWTKGNDFLSLEQICSRLNEIINRKLFSEEDLEYRAIKLNENRIKDEDELIKRKRISYELRVFK